MALKSSCVPIMSWLASRPKLTVSFATVLFILSAIWIAKSYGGNEYEIQPKTKSSTTQDVWIGQWGTWGNVIRVGDNVRICGLAVKYEDFSSGNDDTAANGVKFYFKTFDSTAEAEEQIVESGENGAWKSQQMIADDEFICGLAVQYEDYAGGQDDTAMNGLKMWARKKVTMEEREIIVWQGQWGEWKPRVDVPFNYYLAGLQTQYEPYSSGNDDTALNGIKMVSRLLPEAWRARAGVRLQLRTQRGSWFADNPPKSEKKKYQGVE